MDVLVNRLMEPDLSRRIATAEDAVTLLREAHAHVRNPSINKLPSTLKNDARSWRIGVRITALCALIAVSVFVALSTRNKASQRHVPIQQATSAIPATNASDHTAEAIATSDLHTDWNSSEIYSELKSIQTVLNELGRQLSDPDAL